MHSTCGLEQSGRQGAVSFLGGLQQLSGEGRQAEEGQAAVAGPAQDIHGSHCLSQVPAPKE